MKYRVPSSFLRGLTLVLGLTALGKSLPLPPTSGAASSSIAPGQASGLAETMEVLNQSQRQLRKLVADPVANREPLLEVLSKMESAAIAALAQPPAASISDKITKAERPVWLVRYKRTMARLLQAILTMQEAVHVGDSAAVAKANEEIGAVKQAGHEGFRDL